MRECGCEPANLFARTLCQMNLHFGNRHIACSSLNARYACKLDDVVGIAAAVAAVSTVTAVSNEIIFRTMCMLLRFFFFWFSPCTHNSMEKLFRNAHTYAHTVTQSVLQKKWKSRFLQLNWLFFLLFFFISFWFFFFFGPQNKANDTKCAKQQKLFILDTVFSMNQYMILCVPVFFSSFFFILVAYLIVKSLIAIPNFAECLFRSCFLFVFRFRQCRRFSFRDFRNPGKKGRRKDRKRT